MSNRLGRDDQTYSDAAHGRHLARSDIPGHGTTPTRSSDYNKPAMRAALATAAIDALSNHIAILDDAGVILAVNQAWKAFAAKNGVPEGVDFLGQNYLSICEGDGDGAVVAAGIREVLDGSRAEYCTEYPCPGSGGSRWFVMRVRPLAGSDAARAVVSHEEITDRKLAEDSLQAAHDQLDGRVRDRTQELADANKALFSQVEERRAGEAALRESDDRLRLALRAGMMGVWQIDLNTNLVTRSDSTDLLFGLAPGGVARPLQDYVDRMHAEDVESVHATIRRCVEHGGEQYVEYRIWMPDGEVRWIASRGEVSRGQGGATPILVGASVDVTRSKVTEEALRQSEERYRLLFTRNPHPMWLFNVSTYVFAEVNEAAVRFYGYSREEFLGMTVRELRPPEDVPRLECFLAQGNDEDTRGIWRHQKKDGSIVNVEVTAHTVWFAGVKSRLILANDVTDRLLAEEGLLRAHSELEKRVQARTAELARSNEALRETEALFRQIAENVGEVFWMSNTDKSRMIYISPAYETIWGHSRQSLYDRPMSFLETIIEEDRPKVVANLPRQRVEETTTVYRIRAGDGTIRWIQDRSFPIRNQAGEVYRVAGVAENVDDLKKTEEELSRLVSIAESSDDAILGVSLDGIVMSWNSGAKRIYGYAAEEIVGKPAVLLVVAGHRAETVALLKRVAGGEQAASIETVRMRKNGDRFSVSLTLSAVRDSAGNVTAVSAIERDVTERKRLEREILEIGERERERIGQDLHDGLGQHLTGIAFLSKALQQELAAVSRPEADDARQIAELVQQAIGQARALARGLHPVQSSPNGLMSALQELANRIEVVFRIRCEFVCPRPVLLRNNNAATHLYRIAQEAINNALKHGSARHVKLNLQAAARAVVLVIEDDGVGIDSRLAHSAGEPTGEVDSLSSGMGLRIMTYRAKMVGATVSISRRLTGGTTVTCTLPQRAADPATGGEARKPQSLQADGGSHDRSQARRKSVRRTPARRSGESQGEGAAGR